MKNTFSNCLPCLRVWMGGSTCRLSVEISVLCRLSVKNFNLCRLSVNLSYFFCRYSVIFFLVLSVVNSIFSPFVASRLTPFTPSCLLAKMAKVASLIARPRKCFIRNRLTNQIAGSSLFSSVIILKGDISLKNSNREWWYRSIAAKIECSGFEPWPGDIVFLGKTIYFHSASLHPGE